MWIELRDGYRRPVGEVEIDPAQQPSRARLAGEDREIFLNWDTALDDSGQLRRCLSCGCRDMFREKAYPPIVGVIVVLNYAGLLVGAFGGAENTLVWVGMIVLLVLGLLVLVYARTRLVCYACRTAYYGLPIARYHRSWDRSIADRHLLPQDAAPEASSAAAAGGEPADADAADVLAFDELQREESIA
jgi:hypothetical protein